jgi:hypothetical protein
MSRVPTSQFEIMKFPCGFSGCMALREKPVNLLERQVCGFGVEEEYNRNENKVKAHKD